VNFVSRLCHPSIEPDKARVTELLSHGAARAEAAEFEKEVKTHVKTAKGKRAKGKEPSFVALGPLPFALTS